jgi:hypothetical protein
MKPHTFVHVDLCTPRESHQLRRLTHVDELCEEVLVFGIGGDS